MTVPMKRLQSALEFMVTYAWAILILVIILATLVAMGLFNLGSSTPNLCALPANVGCLSAYLSPTGTLMINIRQATPDPINVVSVGCNDQGNPSADMIPILPPATMLVGANSTFSMECYKTSGGSLTPFTGSVGQAFKGYLMVNYTDLVTGFTHTIEGSLIEKVSALQPEGPYGFGAIEYVPMNVVNSGSATGPNFQEMITINPTTYNTYMAADLGNIRFSSGSSELYSWCESGCTSGSSSAVFWVNIPSGITANSNAVVNLLFLPTTTEYDGVYAGEAPQLSCNNPSNTISGCAAGQYGEYDNGGSVFAYYQNFAGNMLPSSWTATQGQSGSAAYFVSNGLTTAQGTLRTSSGVFTSVNNILETYVHILIPLTPNTGLFSEANKNYIAGGNGNSAAMILFYLGSSGATNIQVFSSNGLSTGYGILSSVAFLTPSNSFYLIGMTVTPNNIYTYNSYSLVNTGTGTFNTNQYILLGDQHGTGQGPYLPEFFQWVRVRTFPPGGTIPSVFPGNVI